MTSDMPRAAVFTGQFLAYSQTFIYQELRHHSRYQAEVFCWRRVNEAQFPYSPVHLGGRLYHYTRYSPQFDARFRSQHYAVVHAHFGTVGISAMRYARKFARPLIVTFHGRDVPLLTSWKRFKPRHWGYAALSRRMLRQMALGLCDSGELRDMLIDFGVSSGCLRVFPLGIDLGRFEVGDHDRTGQRVIMIGRFVEKKGFEYGLRAFAQVAKGSGMELRVIGGGEREGKLRRLAADLGVLGQVRFMGVLPYERVATELAGSDVLLAPSVVAADGDRDSGLMVVKEAGAAGVVPIGTRHGGIPEIIEDGSTGFLVPERDVDAIADRLRTLTNNHGLRRTMAQAARETAAAQFDVRKRVAALEDIYDEVAASFAAKAEQRGVP
jgi:colanic acid/amylovoran biosynthesis glycosyltransferase